MLNLTYFVYSPVIRCLVSEDLIFAICKCKRIFLLIFFGIKIYRAHNISPRTLKNKAIIQILRSDCYNIELFLLLCILYKVKVWGLLKEVSTKFIASNYNTYLHNFISVWILIVQKSITCYVKVVRRMQC